MLVIITWGVIITIVVITVELAHIKRFNGIIKRIIKLENLIEHGKEKRQTKEESEAAKAQRRTD